MSNLEEQVQKKLVGFCKYLNEHVEKWRLCIQESGKITIALSNQAEQVRHIERANLRNVEEFEENKDYYKFSILNGIEEDVQSIKKIIDKLNKTNQELNNKLTTLEKLSLELDWDKKCDLIAGTPIQPPLSRLLEIGLDFFLFFKKSLQNINERFKLINVRNGKSMEDFEKAFRVNLEDKVVLNLLAVTQYVDNPKGVL